MGSKRKFSDFNADAPRHSSKKKHQDHGYVPGYDATKRKSKNAKSSNSSMGSVNLMKKRARTIERRFKAGQDLPANVQNDMERELAHLKQKIAGMTEDKHRKMMIKKYHMVRFFERKKADRLAKQIRKQLDSTTDEEEVKRLNADLHTAEIDGIYCRYFPYREPYISLYPVSSEKSEDASSAAAKKALRSERPPMWKVIEEAFNQGERALVEIRERKPAGKQNQKKVQEQPTKKDSLATTPNQSKKNSMPTSDPAGGQPSKAKRKAQAPRDARGLPGSSSDDDSDGGFFEDD